MNEEKWVTSMREDFPALGNSRDGKPPIYFGNACGVRIYHLPATPEKVKTALAKEINKKWNTGQVFLDDACPER